MTKLVVHCVICCVYVYVLYRYEKVLSRFAHSNLCVSQAMKRDLKNSFGIRYNDCITTLIDCNHWVFPHSATVFYDRPPGRFKPASVEQRHKVVDFHYRICIG